MRWLLLFLLVAACKDNASNSDAGVASCFEGDPSAAPQIVIVHRNVDGGVEPTASAAHVPLIQPPQGGKVMFIGVRARNLDGCPLTLTATLRDPCDQSIIALERRPVLLTPVGDGWLEPQQPIEIHNYSNLPACPRAGLSRGIHDEPYELAVTVRDKDNRTVTATKSVVPFCGEPDLFDRCRCECSQNYVLGGACDLTVDAGVAPGCGDGGL